MKSTLLLAASLVLSATLIPITVAQAQTAKLLKDINSLRVPVLANPTPTTIDNYPSRNTFTQFGTVILVSVMQEANQVAPTIFVLPGTARGSSSVV